MSLRPAWMGSALSAVKLDRLSNLEVVQVLAGLLTLVWSLLTFWSDPSYGFSANAWALGVLHPELLFIYLAPFALAVTLLVHGWTGKVTHILTLSRRQAAGAVFVMAAAHAWASLLVVTGQYGLSVVVGVGLWLVTLFNTGTAAATILAHRVPFLKADLAVGSAPAVPTSAQIAEAPLEQFWCSVPEVVSCLGLDTGQPAFSMEPGQWYLASQSGDRIMITLDDGRQGVLASTEGLVRA